MQNWSSSRKTNRKTRRVSFDDVSNHEFVVVDVAAVVVVVGGGVVMSTLLLVVLLWRCCWWCCDVVVGGGVAMSTLLFNVEPLSIGVVLVLWILKTYRVAVVGRVFECSASCRRSLNSPLDRKWRRLPSRRALHDRKRTIVIWSFVFKFVSKFSWNILELLIIFCLKIFCFKSFFCYLIQHSDDNAFIWWCYLIIYQKSHVNFSIPLQLMW